MTAPTIAREEADDLDRTSVEEISPTNTDLPAPPDDGETEDDGEDLGPLFRPLAVAALSTAAAALMTGGIFGTWGARLIALAGALFGVFWTWVCLKLPKRRVILQALVLPGAFVVGLITLIPTAGGPAKVFDLMGEAVSAGRLLRPPVPFDPGWRPILVILLALVGFATAWVATGLGRKQLALVLPLPVLFLTAISQPAEGEFIGGVVGFLPLLLALTVLFGGDGKQLSELTSAFELKRAIRTVPIVVLSMGLLMLLSNTSFLFPESVYNPAEKPQKPKAIPLGEVRDRVLFTIEGDITGPWKTGALSFYDGKNWRLAPFNPERLESPTDDNISPGRPGDVTVKFTTGDLGTTSVLPGVVGPSSIDGAPGNVVWDPVVGVFRMKDGAVEQGAEYTMTLPKYPTADQLKNAGPARDASEDDTYVPKPTPVIERLLAEAPVNEWERLEFLRAKLNEVVVAVGAGSPDKAVPPSKVDDLLEGSHEGSPFEIVAAEALLARWAGLPARVGYGFDGFNDEEGKKTVRPKNGSNWLEVQFEGYGWVPLIGTPPKAKASLDSDPNARFDPTIEPSDDVAVELYIPVELENLRQLYQQIREFILRALPYVLAAVAFYLSLPALRRALRRRRRRHWAATQGGHAQIAVEYAEFRDSATDLNLGDPYDTPLEYLARVVDDDEHSEFAWLVTRALYGDLRHDVSEKDIENAKNMSRSLRRRMFRVQPLQSRVLATLSRASLREPYTLEIPTVRQLRLRPKKRPQADRRRRPTRVVRIRRTLQRAIPGRK